MTDLSLHIICPYGSPACRSLKQRGHPTTVAIIGFTCWIRTIFGSRQLSQPLRYGNLDDYSFGIFWNYKETLTKLIMGIFYSQRFMALNPHKDMSKPFQRIGSHSNAQVGNDFELAAQAFFNSRGLSLNRNVKIPIGIESLKEEHAFDLGCLNSKVIVECKSHKWTSTGNVPSAKLTVWNEAMYFFLLAPSGYRKIMFVLHDFSQKRGETLAEYYLRIHGHLTPGDVEFWEYNESNSKAVQIKRGVHQDF